MSGCGVTGCVSAVVAKGLCSKHYQRLRATGSIKDGPRARLPLEERFKKKYVVMPGNECWPWIGAITYKGYGMIQEGAKGSKHLLAHRLSYTIHKGPIEQGLFVLHSCDNRSCVNPAHLRTGTQSENILEAFSKGRKTNPVAYGEAATSSKLKADDVHYIRAHPDMRHTELAKMFGVKPNTIRAIRLGRTWRTV